MNVHAGARSGFIFSTVFAFAACAIDLSGLQRTDAGFNPATDPDGSTAGASGKGAGAAGMSGTTGAGGNAAAGSTGKSGSGSGGAASTAAAAGRGGASGSSGAGAGSTPTAGTLSTGGQSSMPTAGMTSPPPAAGTSAAGAPAPPPPDSGVPARTCGLPGLPCCNPGAMCDVGACLRGKCTPYGGFYALTSACAANPCDSRNAYTAGCHCPMGFVDTLLWQEGGACDGGGSGTTEVRSCTAGRTPDIAFGGAWVQGPDDSCTVGCATKNPVTGACSCPAGTQQVSMTVDFTDASCPSASTTLQLCIDGEGMPVNFGGAYAVSQTAAQGCGAANPLTAACSCPPEVVTPQSLHVGSWSIFVCNL